ncbi:Na/Pi cotransporter family protein [Wenzhouxiangella marina]|uniref:Sodium:phosphate symporter n=1 Tax=Wenzhouxiangella marina TaxID=1579979 RepID=A0A0K0XRY5_9GAMM|nr:Na/Pi symporter [Wenzhouxiangella marina]AKS40415.1 sodium:phosphate symporter [Wenzhouxiangella marina]MBB6088263.1 phosphate:Na+ symporter [Wenzhouxiangella marina]
MPSVWRQWPLLLSLALLAWALFAQPSLSGIAGGVALFLLGMRSLEQGLRQLAGGTLQRVLQRSTDRRWKALAFGALTTALSQSSSLISVITIAFLSAGLIPLVAGIGVVFGANLGTTSGAWLVAAFGLKVDIAAWALPLITFGVLFQFLRDHRLQGSGQVLLGIGLVFLGIDYMKTGFEAYQAIVDLSRYAMDGLAGLLVYTLIGLAATVLMQSSHATLILTITALAAGQLSYDNALAVSIGANIGTTVTALISSIGSQIEGRRLAVAHLIFNAVTASVALIAMPLFLWAVDALSTLMGIRPDSHTMKLALFHTLFNLAGLVLMVPMITPLAAWLERWLKAAPPKVDQPRFINDQLLESPAPALAAARLELLRLFDHVLALVARVLGFEPAELRRLKDPELLFREAPQGHAVDVDAVYLEKIKPLHGLTLSFLSRLPATGFRAEQLSRLRRASRTLIEAAKAAKHLQKNLLRYPRDGNEALSETYLALRARLGWLVHHLLDREHEIDELDLETWLAQLELTAKDAAAEADQALDELIRRRLIASEQATSMMNDNAYGQHLETNLLETARLLMPELADQAEETLTPSG